MNDQHEIAQFVVRQGLLTLPEAEQALAQCQEVPLLNWLQQRGWLTPHQAADLDELRRLACTPSPPHEQPTEDAPGRPVAVVYAHTAHPPARDSGQPSDPLRALFGLPEDDRPRRGRFVLEEETPRGKGGMGQVWLAHDDGLGRRVALKEMRPDLADQQEARRRFLLEAQVTSQLQHPGIVPVYEMLQSQQGPFYTMRFVEGRTLSQAIADYHRQPTPAALHDLLGVFVQVGNTLAYAHSRGVVHRDLKPANVILGSFGEVVVLDWGLAMVLGERRGVSPPVTAVWVDDPVMSKAAGGTPGYMAPEQARGEIERLDERADVFGLGAILCEILTGKPPYLGDSAQVQRKAFQADLTDAFARLDGSGNDVELLALCKRCLAAEPGDRPRDAGKVSDELSAYLRGVQERLEQARLARAQAEVKIREERKRRWVQLALAGALVCLLGVAAAGGWYLQRQHDLALADRARQELAVGNTLDKVPDLIERAQWAQTASLLEHMLDQLNHDAPAQLRGPLEQALADVTLAAELDSIRLKVATLVDGTFDNAGTDRAYAEAFARGGLGGDEEDAQSVAQRVRDSAVKGALLAALDNWAFSLSADSKRRSWLMAVARAADPHPWRDRLRDPAVWFSLNRVSAVAAEAKGQDLSPQVASSLGATLLDKQAIELLREAQSRHPADFWVNFTLGVRLGASEEAVGYLRVAVALRPDASAPHNHLGIALAGQGKVDEAIACYKKAIEREPRWPGPHNNLGDALAAKGKVDEAIACYKKAIELNPGDARLHSNLGYALTARGKVDEAIACYKKALDLEPLRAEAHTNLGNALEAKEKLDEAIACHKKALDLDPRNAPAQTNLGRALAAKGQVDEAIACYKKALDLDPRDARIHNNLGIALTTKGKVDEAIVCYKKSNLIQGRPAHTTTWALP